MSETHISTSFVHKLRTRFLTVFAQNSWRYKFCDIFANTVVKSCKKVKSFKKTICDTCAQKSWSLCFVTFSLIQM